MMKRLLLTILAILAILALSLSAQAGDGKKGGDGARVLETLPQNKVYLVLIEGNNFITDMARLVGFQGRFYHIEVIYAGKAYGCRPHTCSSIPVRELATHFLGQRGEVRRFDYSGGDPDRAVRQWQQNFEGRAYDLLYRNCTDAVWGLSVAYGVREQLVEFTDVRAALQLPGVIEILVQQGLPLPNRRTIMFPDAFANIGATVATIRF